MIRLLLAALLVGSIVAPAAAHEFEIRDALVVVRADGSYLADLRVDVDALALGVSPTVDDAELVAALEAMSPAELALAVERAHDTVRRRVRVRFDGQPADPRVEFPGDAPGDERPTVLGTIARLSGRVPDDAGDLVFSASRAFGVVQLTVLDERSLDGTRVVLAPGERSPAWKLDRAASADAGAPDTPSTVLRYTRLGFEHILPLGLDHILFVIGLFLLSTRLAPLLWQVSAFTLAHTVTLALSTSGVIALPASIVEPLIALSIAYVAIENLVTERLHPWRPALVFGFGLLHGLGFAGVLRELGLPEGEWLPALISFNIGVELGQLAVIGLAFLAVGWFRERDWYRPAIVRPASLVIALIALYWTITRSLGA